MLPRAKHRTQSPVLGTDLAAIEKRVVLRWVRTELEQKGKATRGIGSQLYSSPKTGLSKRRGPKEVSVRGGFKNCGSVEECFDTAMPKNLSDCDSARRADTSSAGSREAPVCLDRITRKA